MICVLWRGHGNSHTCFRWICKCTRCNWIKVFKDLHMLPRIIKRLVERVSLSLCVSVATRIGGADIVDSWKLIYYGNVETCTTLACSESCERKNNTICVQVFVWLQFVAIWWMRSNVALRTKCHTVLNLKIWDVISKFQVDWSENFLRFLKCKTFWTLAVSDELSFDCDLSAAQTLGHHCRQSQCQSRHTGEKQLDHNLRYCCAFLCFRAKLLFKYK